MNHKVEFEVGTVDDQIAFQLNCGSPVTFPLVFTLKMQEALSIIAAISSAIIVAQDFKADDQLLLDFGESAQE